MIPEGVKRDILLLLNAVERAHAAGYTVSRPRLASLQRIRDWLREAEKLPAVPQAVVWDGWTVTPLVAAVDIDLDDNEYTDVSGWSL